jgi:hypothetical protein
MAMGRERTEREQQASEEFSHAVAEQAARFFDALLEEVRRNPEAYNFRVLEPRLSEEELGELVDREVHAVREELWAGRRPERGPLTEDEIADWERRREERRRHEGYRPI